ncbi:MAG: hypothetical protein IJ509_01150 [Bacilli bacterium]|nr:hypothetical protein [Bacilli bacterium]
MKNIESTNQINKEIEKMAHMITKRYNIQNSASAKELATTLYNSGINFEKFSPKYYKGEFDLDEIVNHLIKKREYDRKVIPITPHLPEEAQSTTDKPNKQTEVVLFPQNYARAKGRRH